MAGDPSTPGDLQGQLAPWSVPDTPGPVTFDLATSSMDGGNLSIQPNSAQLPEPLATIVRVAYEVGVDPNLALAIAKQESGFNAGVIGDGGHSVGLFQLNDAGEGAGMTVAQRSDAETNARIALTQVKAVADAHPDWSPGQIAVAAQRPAEYVRTQYIANINSWTQQSGGDLSWWATQAQNAAPGTPAGSGTSNLPIQGGAAGSLPVENPQQWLSDHYADVAPYMQIPDLADIITKAAQENWTNDQIRGALEATNWWKSTSDTARNWQELQGSDPAEAQRQLEAKRQHIIQLAEEKGVSLTADDLNTLPEQAIKNGWDDNIITAQLASKMTLNEPAGASMTNEADIKKIAKDWGFNLDDNETLSWMQGMAKGVLKPQDLTTSLQQRAIQTYGSNQSLVQAMQSGTSPAQFFQPYAQVVENELGLPKDSLNWQDPKWQVSMNYSDPKTGVMRPMNVSEWQQQIRSDPQYGWKYSDTANNLVGNLEKTITTAFGAVK